MVYHWRLRVRHLSTTRLYYTDARLLAFEARVVETADDGRAVYLDQTAFYPTSGGQPFDTGTLGSSRVLDVIDEGDRIRHLIDPPLASGVETVRGTIDAGRRTDHMQQHTGQHLLSALFQDLFGYATVSVHFGAERSTLDLDTESLSVAQLLKAQASANDLVAENRPVTVGFEDAAAAIGLRKAPDREGTIRVISIDAIDRSACGGTHVSTTCEIGAILLRSTERIRKTTRVEFVCGTRAIRTARADYDRLTGIATALSTSLEEVATVVAAQAGSLRESEQQLRKLERELATHRARELFDHTDPSPAGRRTIVLDSAPTMDELRTLAQALIALPHVAVIGVIAEPPSILFATSADTGIDAGKALKEALQAAGGRGGGSPRTAQGSIPTIGAASGVISALRASLG